MATSPHEIHSVLTEKRVFEPPREFSKAARIRNMEEYRKLCAEADSNPDAYWAARGREELYWKEPFRTTMEWNAPNVKWYLGGKTNLSYNCLDRHLEKRGNKTAIVFEGEPGEVRKLTYRELHEQVCRFANGLKSLGVKKGDRVGIYLPMIAEAAVAMLACARIGAVHSVVFGGFSSEALRDRMNDAGAKVLITADAGYRKGTLVPLKKNVDGALAETPGIEKVVVLNRTGGKL